MRGDEPYRRDPLVESVRVPRMRGDEPYDEQGNVRLEPSSPHARG